MMRGMRAGGRIICGLVSVVGCALALFACHAHRPGVGCVEGAVVSCVCPDNSNGVQSCQEDNTFGACRCQLGVKGPSGTGGGTAGKTAGTGGASASAGGAGGITPIAGAGGTAGTNGRAGTGAQAAGAGGVGPAGRGASGTSPMVPAFSPCMNASNCGAEQTCTFSVMGATFGYCSPTCGQGRACPQPANGTVRAVCTANVCVLGNCQRAQCPDGMVCVSMGGRSGMLNGSSCAYPTK